MTLEGFDFEAFVDGYIECILWCDVIPPEANPEHPEHNDSWCSGGGEELTLREGVRDEIIEKGQLREFCEMAIDDLMLYCGIRDFDPSQGKIESYAGHDFYLTRAYHGAGFWDRRLGKLGDRLTEASQSMGWPDDHMIYDMGDGTAAL